MEFTELQGGTLLRDAPSIINKNFRGLGTEFEKVKKDVEKVLDDELVKKLDKNQGIENAGKSLEVGEDGFIKLGDGGGHLIVDNVPEPTEAKEKLVYFNEVSDAHEVLPPVEISVPVGTILAWYTNRANPIGWIDVPNGTPLSKSAYPALFNVYGYDYTPEAEQGGDLFYLPNPYGRFLEGNEVAGQYKEAGLPNIRGFNDFWIYGVGNNKPTGAFSPSREAVANMSPNTGVTPSQLLTFDASFSDPHYGKSDTVQPASITVRYIIKAYDSINYDTNDVSVAQLTDSVNELNLVASRTDVVASGSWHTADNSEFYYWEKYINGKVILSGVGIQQPNNANCILTYPFPIYFKNVTANVIGDRSNNWMGIVTPCPNDTTTLFRVRDASNPSAIPSYVIAFGYTIIGRWK